MDPTRDAALHREARELFAQALELPAVERAAFVARACAGREELKAEVSSLLSAHDNATGFLDPTDASTVGLTGAAPTVLKRVDGYEIVRELGAGGMGTVYEADDARMDRRVALKVMSRHHAPSEKSALRFEQEAWIAGKLDHPNIVKVFERGEWQELSYYAMEVVAGGSLHDVVGQMKRWGRDERWQLEFGSREYVTWAIRKTIEAARALDYAHRQGVVHRDVKPMNLLLSREHGSVKIADFGLAIEQDATRMTTAGQILGTISFMAPEQMLGKQDAIDRRTDVYALGATLFQLLTLELPFAGKTQQLYMNAALTSDARRASKFNQRVSRDLEIVIGKALEKRRRDRYATAAEFADDLENVIDFRPIRAQPVGALTRATKWIRRKPAHAALLAALVVALPSLGLLVQRTLNQQRIERAARIAMLVREARGHELRQDCRDVIDRAQRILDLDETNTDGLTFRALCRASLAEQADADERAALERGALADVDRLVELAPRESVSQRVRASVLRRLDRPDGASRAELLAAQYRSEPLTDRELAMDARLALIEGRFEDAMELYRTLTTRAPDNGFAVWSRGTTYDFLEDYDRAYTEYRLALSIDPELKLVYIDVSRLAIQRGDFAEAREYARRAVQLSPELPQAHEALAHYHVEYGKTLANEAAAREFDAAARAARESIRLLQAAGARSQALADNPERAWSYINLGSALVEKNRLPGQEDPKLLREAKQAYETVLTLWEDTPSRPEEYGAYEGAWLNNCDVSILLGELERATEVCNKVTDLLPSNAVAFYNLAAVHALSGRREQALDALRKDLELGDTDWDYLAKDPWFASLRDDPGFREILAEMKRAANS